MRITAVLIAACAIIAVPFVLSDSGRHPDFGPSLSARIMIGFAVVLDLYLVGYMIEGLRNDMTKDSR
ncbi:MAG TPA: hypothetical protein VGN12_28400 [Pirellulales bacterium]|jgi:hypothetical protein